MAFWMVLSKLKSLLLFLVGLVRRSLCCFRRRRRSSTDSVQLTQVGVVSQYGNDMEPQDVESWNHWGDGTDRPPQTVQEHIDHYRRQSRSKQAGGQQLDQHLQEHQDFFQDMEPEIRKPPKVLLKSRENESDVPSRLAFVPDAFPSPVMGGELGAWEEYEGVTGGNWGSEASETEILLREKRKEEQRRRALEREQQSRRSMTTLASRVSS